MCVYLHHFDVKCLKLERHACASSNFSGSVCCLFVRDCEILNLPKANGRRP